MARSIQEIQKIMLDAKAASAELNGLQVLTQSEIDLDGVTSTSKVSIWRMIMWIVSFCIWVHEAISEKNAVNSRPLNRPNFISAVLNFHDGLPLVWKDGQFQYDLTNVPNPDSLKIISRCALLEGSGKVVVKVAHDNNGTLEPISDQAAERVLGYIKSFVLQPGPKVEVVNKSADLLKATIRVYVDPQMIDLATGKQLNSETEIFPAKAAITEYLTGLIKAELNGAFVVNKFKRTIEDRDGIDLVEVDLMQSSFDAAPFVDFQGWKVPESGYFKFNDNDLTITYLPYVLVND